MKKNVLLILAVFALLLNSSTPSFYQNSLLQHELATLDQRGVTYRMLPGNQLEVTDPRSGQRWMFDAERLLTPHMAPHDTISTLTIDLTSIDTSLYNWRFRYLNTVPISEGWGFPLQVHDFDENGEVEAYGAELVAGDVTTRAYELSQPSSWILRYTYPGRVGIVDKMGDADGNGLKEIYARYGDTIYVFEQNLEGTIPTVSKFHHNQWYLNATGIPNEVASMTGSPVPEILYRGSEPFTSEDRTYISRYDSSINNFGRIWSMPLPPGCSRNDCANAIATGDFDSDGKMEFVTSDFGDDLYVVEHVVGDSFAVTAHTHLQTITGRAASGDVDGNGITEFFIGGTEAEPDGYVHLRAYAFERTSDDSYQRVFAFNIFPAGIFFVDLYQTTDVDGDGIPELLLSFAGGIMVIKGAGEHNYELFYYKSVSSLDGLSAWKINSSRAASLFVSRSIGSRQTDVYELDSTLITSVREESKLPLMVRLFQNYPNPFNPTTSIAYLIPTDGFVSLTIYDILGREAMVLEQSVIKAGSHVATFDASYLSLGIYFYRLSAAGNTITRKMVLIK